MRGGTVCSLQPGRKYYCNLTAGGWENAPEARPNTGSNNSCVGLIAQGPYDIQR